MMIITIIWKKSATRPSSGRPIIYDYYYYYYYAVHARTHKRRQYGNGCVTFDNVLLLFMYSGIYARERKPRDRRCYGELDSENTDDGTKRPGDIWCARARTRHWYVRRHTCCVVRYQRRRRRRLSDRRVTVDESRSEILWTENVLSSVFKKFSQR